MNNLWFLTEERPKIDVLVAIFEKFAKDRGFAVFIDAIRIFPILKNNEFTFTYEVTGFRCNKVDRVFIKTVSGNSSFTDYLIFYQEKEPVQSDIPIYAIEETKTDDSESRNTGVYQRCSKFVFIKHYYPEVKMIMLYNLQVAQKEKQTLTNLFGTRMLLTLGVEIMGKAEGPEVYTGFRTIDELIAFKEKMRQAPKGNVPISIKKYADKIIVTGRLYKSGGLSHDPNIGALSLICSVLRELGWTKEIVIANHGLRQEHVGAKNKFIQIANSLDIKLEGLTVPNAVRNESYWKYDLEGEKLGTIFIHLVVENFTQGKSIYENHAGCERGYFITSKGEHLAIPKYMDREKYKNGDKEQIIYIPDLILQDIKRNEIINIEGKKYKYRLDGINELKNYDYIEKHFILKNYPAHTIVRTVVLYGSKEKQIFEVEVGFLLNENGQLILGVKAPKLFHEAITNLLDFWK